MVNRIVQAYRDERRIQDTTRKPKSRVTTEQQDCDIVAFVAAQPTASVQEIRANLRLQASKTTVKRRIAKAGLSSRIAAKKPLFRKENKSKRLLFAQEHRDWTVDQWKHVAFATSQRFPQAATNSRKSGDLAMAGKYFLTILSIFKITRKASTKKNFEAQRSRNLRFLLQKERNA